MDAPSKMLLLMLVLALLLGALVVRNHPNFRSEAILATNDENLYYPSAK